MGCVMYPEAIRLPPTRNDVLASKKTVTPELIVNVTPSLIEMGTVTIVQVLQTVLDMISDDTDVHPALLRAGASAFKGNICAKADTNQIGMENAISANKKIIRVAKDRFTKFSEEGIRFYYYIGDNLVC